MVSCLMFKSLSSFEFIFMYGVRVCSNLIDLHAAIQLSQNLSLKSLFPILYPCLLCQRLIYCRVVGLFLGCLSSCQYHTLLSEVWESYVFFPQDYFGNSGSFMVPCKILDYLF